jgi:hypothetical protein
LTVYIDTVCFGFNLSISALCFVYKAAITNLLKPYLSLEVKLITPVVNLENAVTAEAIGGIIVTFIATTFITWANLNKYMTEAKGGPQIVKQVKDRISFT